MYQKKYYLGVTEVDENLELKLSSFFVMMQEVATEHAEMLGIGKQNTIDKGQFWVVIRYSVDIIKSPKYLETITVNTYPGDDKKFIFPRYFEVLSESGEILIRASSTWCVLNKSDHQIVFNPFGEKVLPVEHHENEEPLPKKVLSKDNELMERRMVRYSDTDLNGHLNNVKYIEYIIDMHNSKFYKENRISHITINYEKEILAGNEVLLYSSNDNPEYICGIADDKVSFHAEIEYQKR